MQRLMTIPLLVLLASACARQPVAPPSAEDLPTPQAPGASAESVVSQLQSEISFWRRHTQKDPQSHIGWTNISMRCLSLARAMGGDALYAEAAAAARESLRIFARPNPDAQACLAVALSAGHRFREARDMMDTAISESPDESGLYGIRGDAHFGLGDYELADKDYRAMHKAKPSMASLSRRAAIAWVFGDSGHALALYRQAAEESPGVGTEPEAWAHFVLGVHLLKVSRVAEARSAFADSLRVAPDYTPAMTNLALTLETEGRSGDARVYLETALQARREPTLMRRLAATENAAGAAELLRQADAIELQNMLCLREDADKGQIAHLRELAELLLDRGEHTAGLKFAQQDLAVRRDLHGCRVMARALRLNGRAHEAVPYADEMLRYKTTDKQLWDEAEAVYQQAGLSSAWLRDNRPCP